MALHKTGHFYLPEGRQLFTDISKNINKLRYSTSIVKNDETIEQLFKSTLRVLKKFYLNPHDLT
jgi:hypothetical protein